MVMVYTKNLQNIFTAMQVKISKTLYQSKFLVNFGKNQNKWRSIIFKHNARWHNMSQLKYQKQYKLKKSFVNLISAS